MTTKLIAINGLSSSGKTSLAESLAKKLPNAVAVSGDMVMFSSFLRNQQYQLDICDRTFDTPEEFFDYYFQHESNELLSAIVNDPDLDNNFATEIENILTNSPKLQFIIVEWTLLNIISSIWNKAVVTITVKTSPEVQKSIFGKHIEEREDLLEALEIRNNVANPLIQDGDFVIHNNNDRSFYDEIDALLHCIREKLA